MRTRIKFCGITRAEDVRAAVALGVDAIGLVLVPDTPRQLGFERAANLRRQVPPFVQVVALFKDATQADVSAAVRQVAPDVLQFHGSETPEFCSRFGRPYVKAVPMGEEQSLPAWRAKYADAAALLLDAHDEGEDGGQGRSFDWRRVQADLGIPLVLAGGLTPDNVRLAVETLHPYAVDVSTGIEQAPGTKDYSKMKRFIEEAWVADAGF